MATLLNVSSCGKVVGLETLVKSIKSEECTSLLHWRYVQPQPAINRAVDLLFVVDTSSSLVQERSRLASALPSFLAELSQDADLRIAVMPAHGGASSLSGRLYSARNTPLVLDTKTQSFTKIQDQLEQTLSLSPKDGDEANGEMLLYSLQKSFGPQRLSEIRSQGFYRDQAALSIVFVTDENDVCYSPTLHGYSNFPDYAPSISGWEAIAFNRYCTDVSAGSVVKSAKALKTNQKLSWAGIVHTEAGLVPSGGEDSIGHGIIELVQQASLDGINLDIVEGAFATGLAALGSVVSSQLDLQLSFALDGSATINPNSVFVSIDSQPVINSQYDPDSRTVQIPASDAGRAGSVVEITACAVN